MAQNDVVEGPYSSYPTDFKEADAADVTAWKLARSVIEHENNLVALIFAIGALAMYMCVVTSSGIESAYKALGHVTRHYADLHDSLGFHRTPPLHEWSRPSMFGARRVPFVTLIIWVTLVGIVAIGFLVGRSRTRAGGSTQS